MFTKYWLKRAIKKLLTVLMSLSLSSAFPTLHVVPITFISLLRKSDTALSTLAWRRLLTTTCAPLWPKASAAASPILRRSGSTRVCQHVMQIFRMHVYIHLYLHDLVVLETVCFVLWQLHTLLFQRYGTKEQSDNNDNKASYPSVDAVTIATFPDKFCGMWWDIILLPATGFDQRHLVTAFSIALRKTERESV